MNKLDIHPFLLKARTNGGGDDFNSYTNGQLWTKFQTSNGDEAVTCGDSDGGILALTGGASKDGVQGVRTTNKLFTFQSNKPLLGQIELNFTDADTNNILIAFGFCSAWGSTLFADDTWALTSSFSGSLIYKLPGETVWRVVSSVGTTNQATKSTLTAQQPGLNQRLVVQLQPQGGYMEASFWGGVYGINGGNSYAGQLAPGINPLLNDLDGTGIAKRSLPIKHAISYTSAAAMNFGFLIKEGSAVLQTLNVDYAGWEYLSRP